MTHYYSNPPKALRFSKWAYVEHALAGFGGILFTCMVIALLTWTHFSFDNFGTFIVVLIAFVYGIIRGNQRKKSIRYLQHLFRDMEFQLHTAYQAADQRRGY